MNRIKVWDPLQRLLHWSLVLCVLANWVNESVEQAHRLLGYGASGLVLTRLLWGLIGSRHARFADWFPWPSRLLPYLAALLRGHPPRYLGHNPAGAVMMLLLLALVLALGISGYAMGLDAFWGEEWLEEVHEALASLLQLAVALHVLAAMLESLRHRENLVLAMLHGYKRAAAPVRPQDGAEPDPDRH